MRKLLWIVLIFLMIGTVSAHEDVNVTSDSLLKDVEYNSDIDDEMLIVEENDNIPVAVNVEEAWSLNVYIDGHNSTINDEFVDAAYDQIDIPTSIVTDGEESLALGKHDITYEFKFTNTTSIYSPDVYISDSGIYFDFSSFRTIKNPQNSIYRFNSQFYITESIDPISTTLNLDDINITYSDSISFDVKGINSGRVIIYLDDALFNSFDIDENPYEEEIDTTKLDLGSYNLVCIVESDKGYVQYDVSADTSNSMISVKFTKSKISFSPNRYITIINTTLNVGGFPELNKIYMDTPSIDIAYTKSIPVRFEGEGAGDFTVYIDGVKVYDNSILLSWQNICYVPTKDTDGNYFNAGLHNISFEFVFSDKYYTFNPQVSWYNNVLTFNFLESHDSSVFLNDKYIADTELNIIDKGTQFIPIYSQANVSIVHTNDINLKIDGLSYLYNLTVFVDDVEIYDSYTNNDMLSIKTFLPRSSIFETNERDIQEGSYRLRFEFGALYEYDVDVEFKDNELYFKFRQTDSDIRPDGVHYQFNTSLTVSENERSVHILNVKNYTYFDDTELSVKMDVYEPENYEDWEDMDDDVDEDMENPIGTQDVGIIVSDEDGIVYIGDDLINVYERQYWNHQFVNEKLSKAGIYTIKIVNLADNTYDTASFEVKKANRVFSRKYSSDDFNVLFTLDFSSCREDLNGICRITLDGEEKVINVKKGLVKSKKEVLFKDIDPGVYTATFSLDGNEIYNDVTLKSKVTVKKESPTIDYHKSGGNELGVTIDISQSKTDAILTVGAGGEQKKFTVNSNTKYLSVEFDNLNLGYHNVKIDFKGNERYNSKTLSVPFEITSYSKAPVEKPLNDTNQTGHGLGNNTGGIGTGSGDSNVTGSGNGTFNGKMSINVNGFGGDFGSQGSGHGDGAKSYEITKNILNDDNVNVLFVFFIMALIILVLSFVYERRDSDDSDEY